MESAPRFASASGALEAITSGMRFLAELDAASAPGPVAADVLRALEKADAIEAVARGRLLWLFDLDRGYEGEGYGGVRNFVRNGTRVTLGQAKGHTGLIRFRELHPAYQRAMLDGCLTLSVGQRVGKLTAKIDDDAVRASVDEMVATAARAGASEHDLIVIAGAAMERFAPPDPDRPFTDRSLKLDTTFDGAGVLRGELTPECAAMLGAVLSRLALKRGAGDDRNQLERNHDALAEMCRRLLGSDLIPRQSGHAVTATVHIWLGDLLDLDDGSVLARAWTERYAAKWAAKRMEAAEGIGDGGAWISGPAAGDIACDAVMFPVVWGDPDLDAAEDLLRIAVELDRWLHRHDQEHQDGTPDNGGGTPDNGGGAAGRLGAAAADPDYGETVIRLMRDLIGTAARMMAGEPGLAAFLRRGLLGPLGLGGASLPLDAGDTDHVPWWIRDIVHARDGHCQFPRGCGTPAQESHQHHIVPRAKHGHSSTENLGDYCKQHHLYTIHANGWMIRKLGDGTWEATAPDGRTFRTPGRSPPPRPG
jgi:hypothetical protein